MIKNMSKEDKLEARKKRGQINSNDLKNFKEYNYLKLIDMLSDENSQKRTIASNLLNSKFLDISLNEKNIVINELAKHFKKEKALYSRIAISESLVSYNELAVPYLIQLLGQIGSNQEKDLPKKYFNKKSFPLPRDLAARTLAKIGVVAIPFLMNVLDTNFTYTNNNSTNNNFINHNFTNFNFIDYDNSNFVKEQAIDAIGAIAYKYDDHRSLNSLKNLFESTKTDSYIIVWKIVRSLSGFKNNKHALNLVFMILNEYDDCAKIQWEGIRSIGQIGIINDDVKDILNDIHKKINNNHNNYDFNEINQINIALNISMDSLGL
jgi:hypothetical protein